MLFLRSTSPSPFKVELLLRCRVYSEVKGIEQDNNETRLFYYMRYLECIIDHLYMHCFTAASLKLCVNYFVVFEFKLVFI